MNSLFQNDFTLRVDTSACVSMITGYDHTMNDTWYYSDQAFESGKIYGLVSERGQGCQYLSYLLGGRLPFEQVRVFCNGASVTQHELRQVSLCLEPSEEGCADQNGRRAIGEALSRFRSQETLEDVADRFLLDLQRLDRPFGALSGMRWRAASALGYAQRKRIFYAPYKPSHFYYQACQSLLLKPLWELANDGALVLLPVGSDEFIRHIADEVVYLNRPYDVDALRWDYVERFGGDWIH